MLFFSRGGILQTITGQNLDSVFSPTLSVLYESVNNYSAKIGEEVTEILFYP